MLTADSDDDSDEPLSLPSMTCVSKSSDRSRRPEWNALAARVTTEPHVVGHTEFEGDAAVLD